MKPIGKFFSQSRNPQRSQGSAKPTGYKTPDESTKQKSKRKSKKRRKMK